MTNILKLSKTKHCNDNYNNKNKNLNYEDKIKKTRELKRNA